MFAPAISAGDPAIIELAEKAPPRKPRELKVVDNERSRRNARHRREPIVRAA